MRKAQDDPVQRQIMEAGDLVGEDRFQTVISRAILQAPQDIPLILDGVAKRPKEAPWLVDFLGKHGYEIVFVIHLDLDQATAAKRNQDRTDNRQDDDPTKQAMRRKLYDIETMQSIRWFCENFPHVRIDGNNTREAIVAQARTALEEHLPLAA